MGGRRGGMVGRRRGGMVGGGEEGWWEERRDGREEGVGEAQGSVGK